MKTFRIYSPVLGKREDVPSVLLANSFVQDCEDVVMWNGEIRKVKKRLPELKRTTYEIKSISLPTYDVTGTIDPDYTETNIPYGGEYVGYPYYIKQKSPYVNVCIWFEGPGASWIVSTAPGSTSGPFYDRTMGGEITGTYIPSNGASGDATVELNTTSSFVVSGDHRTEFLSGESVIVYGSSGNDGTYTISGNSTLSGTDTVISTVESILHSDASGSLFNTTGVYSTDDSDTADFLKVRPPDNNPIIRYELLYPSSGTHRLVAFTKRHIYYWDNSLTRWQLLFTGSADCDYWDACQYGDYLCATNDTDVPIYWGGDTATSFSGIDTASGPEVSTGVYISKAKFIASYNHYLILGGVTLSDATVNLNHIYYSAIGAGVGAASDWEVGGAGDAGYRRINGEGEISGGFGLYQGYLIIFKRGSARKLWFTGSTDPFEDDSLFDNIGCIAPGSVVNNKEGDLLFYATDKSIRSVYVGKISQAIDDTTRSINVDSLAKIRATYIAEYDALEWAVPLSANTENNKILFFRQNTWSLITMPVVAFGRYHRQASYTWDTLPFSTWDTWAWDRWDNVVGATDFPTELCSDSNGCTYQIHGSYTDDGAEYESHFVLATDMAKSGALGFYKRCHFQFPYLYSSSSTLTMSVKRNQEAAWQSLGTVSISGSNEIQRLRSKVDVRAQDFLFKYSFTGSFRFIGAEYDYQPQGRR